MKKFFADMKISRKITALVLIAIFSLAIYAVISQLCLNVVKINGTYYQNINQGKDLVADILPPPEYIIESYLTANEIADTTNTATELEYIDRLASLEKDYNTRHDYWVKTLPEGELKKAFTVDSYKPAVEFFKVLDEKFIPAVKNNDKLRQSELVNGDLQKYYNLNREAIDKVVTQANDWSNRNVESADTAVTAAIIAEIIFSVLALLIIIFCGVLIVRSLSRPIKKIVQAADSIAKGNLEVRLDIKGRDEIGLLAAAFDKIIASLKQLAGDSAMLAEAAVQGRLSVRAETAAHSGEYQKIIVGVNDTLDALTGPLYIAACTVERLSRGDIPDRIKGEFQGDFSLLIDNLNICIDSINGLTEDAELLSRAAMEGRLSVRADASRHEGDYKKIIDGLNGTMESVVTALNSVAGAIGSISRGEIPEPIPTCYAGDYNNIVQNLNTCIESINALIADAEMLSKAAVEGRLSVRADLTRHQGDYAKIILNLNNTMESVVSALSMAGGTVRQISRGQLPQPITAEYSGDYESIKEGLNTCIESINALVADAEMLSKAAAEGNLSVRADAGRHQGDFGKIIEGVNLTMDAVILPLQETASVLSELSQGRLEARVSGDYHGELADLKVTINQTLTTLSGYISEISETLNEVANMNLGVEITTEYKGDFDFIKQSINNIVGSLNEILNNMLGEISMAADEVAAGAQQISNSSQNLSEGASQQASTVEQLTASISEISSGASRNAKSSNKAKTLAESVMKQAEEGAGYMLNLSGSMRDISESSVSISKIIKVIDDMAFQTNILALNAAVEAARAGQYGKGFAVVAEEVRSLAGRSAEAANEIRELIESTSGKVAKGTEILSETAQRFDSIVGGIGEIAEAVSIIDTASNEQMMGLIQVSNGIEVVSNVVQTIAATSQENAASSGELSTNSKVLKGQLQKFSLKAIEA